MQFTYCSQSRSTGHSNKWPGHCTLDDRVKHYTPHALQWVRPMYVWHTMWNVNWQFSEGLDRFFTWK